MAVIRPEKRGILPWTSATPSPELAAAIAEIAPAIAHRIRRELRLPFSSCAVQAALWAWHLKGRGFSGWLLTDGAFSDERGAVGHDWVEVLDGKKPILLDGAFRQFRRLPELRAYWPDGGPGTKIPFAELTPELLRRTACVAVVPAGARNTLSAEDVAQDWTARIIASGRRDTPESAILLEVQRRTLSHGNEWIRVCVPIDQINADFQHDTPSPERLARAQRYARRASPFPPGIGFFSGRSKPPRIYLADGNHRALAAYLRGDPTFDVFMPASEWKKFQAAIARTRGRANLSTRDVRRAYRAACAWDDRGYGPMEIRLSPAESMTLGRILVAAGMHEIGEFVVRERGLDLSNLLAEEKTQVFRVLATQPDEPVVRRIVEAILESPGQANRHPRTGPPLEGPWRLVAINRPYFPTAGFSLPYELRFYPPGSRMTGRIAKQGFVVVHRTRTHRVRWLRAWGEVANELRLPLAAWDERKIKAAARRGWRASRGMDVEGRIEAVRAEYRRTFA